MASSFKNSGRGKSEVLIQQLKEMTIMIMPGSFQSPYPVYSPSAPLGLNYQSQTRWMEGGASASCRTNMGRW